MTLILERARASTHAWSVRIAAIGAAIYASLLTIDPTALQAAWSSMPPELRALLPQHLQAWISLALFVAVAVARTVPQPAAAHRLGLISSPAPAMKVGPLAIALLHHFERCRLVAYLCPAGKWTIGWGMTYYPDGRRVKAGDRITQDQADAMFEQLLARDFAPAVLAAIGRAPITAAQFGAMVVLAYNIGKGAFRSSTVLRLHRAGEIDAAARAFALFNKSNGQISSGLIRRRAAEAALYLGDFAELKAQTHGEVAA
ncbi:lysozyme [Sphingomonas sp. BK580]|uniref:lysozyme n=1 Tax=Sphingomonas sp. BK580 TaxID=2586972 RepID=UPI0017EE7EFA|nr:lysozyme [Sphingomonas sp. BK580]MBB3691443.1 GH24 family phage-related lysozyme (muramidase) [Sphingomonas sp. BK580]